MNGHRSVVRRHRGGISTAIAIPLAMIVIVSLVQNIYVGNQYITDDNRERLQEYLSIEQIYFDVNENLVVSVRNTGAVDARLVAVWVEPTTSPNETQRFTVSRLIGSDLTQDLTIDHATLNALVSFTDDFSVTVVTERGNLVTETYTFIEPSPVGYNNPPLGQLGIFRVNWFYCRYSSFEQPPHPVYGAMAEASYVNKSNDYVAFYISLKNAWDRPCKVEADSFLAFTSISPPQGAGEPNFFIVQAVDYSESEQPQITPYDNEVNPIIVYPNQTLTLIFAAEGIEAPDMWRWGNSYPFGPETRSEGSGIQTTMFFEIYDYDANAKRWVPSGKYAGQNISTQAVILRKLEEETDNVDGTIEAESEGECRSGLILHAGLSHRHLGGSEYRHIRKYPYA